MLLEVFIFKNLFQTVFCTNNKNNYPEDFLNSNNKDEIGKDTSQPPSESPPPSPSSSTMKNDDYNDPVKSNPSPDKSDIIFLILLAILFFSFVYFFIRYLLAQSRSFKQIKDSRPKEDSSVPVLSDRRFRFGRIRRSSGGRPWLNPLDPFPSGPADKTGTSKFNEDLDHHDYDYLIKSVITPEAALKEHDPFGTLTKATPDNKVFELSDHFGLFSAGILAILCIFLLSNLEE